MASGIQTMYRNPDFSEPTPLTTQRTRSGFTLLKAYVCLHECRMAKICFRDSQIYQGPFIDASDVVCRITLGITFRNHFRDFFMSSFKDFFGRFQEFLLKIIKGSLQRFFHRSFKNPSFMDSFRNA